MTKAELLPILDSIAQGIAATFGSNCETVVQDLTTMDHPLLSIYNGHVSGRSVGSTVGIQDDAPCDYTLDIKILQSPHINLYAEQNGVTIKTTTIPVQAEDGILGLGINFDISTLTAAENALRSITEANGYLYKAFESMLPSPMDSMLTEAAASFNKELTELNKQERQTLLKRLDTNHFFDHQKAVPYLSEKLGVSRYTIYKDLKEIQ